jgi:hypothetical protein
LIGKIKRFNKAFTMFEDNKYKKWYDAIIKNAKERNISGYIEKHHIIPRCMGGSNNIHNLAKLTAREHFLCHWLLTKCVTGTFYKKKMLNALGRFVQSSTTQQRKLSSRQYEIARKAIAIANTQRLYTNEMRKKMSLANSGRVPWNKGKRCLQQYPLHAKEKLKELYNGISFIDRHGATRALEIKEKISQTKLGKPSGMLGKQHSASTKQKMSKNMKGPRGPQTRISRCPTCNNENVTFRHIKFCNIDWNKK